MLKMKDFLLVVVADGWTGINIFLLICSLLALAMSVLDFTGKLKKAKEEEQRKEEGKEQDKQP